MGRFNKQKNFKNRFTKLCVVFDEAKRKEFLTGFHKRNVEKRKRAQIRLEKRLKEERKRLKAEAKESYKKLIKSRQTIPELEKFYSEEYEDDGVKVKITELSSDIIARENNWIGNNHPKVESDEGSNVEEEVEEDAEEVPGMELKQKTHKFTSERDIKIVLKKENVKKMKKSKIFQKKNKVEKNKHKKQSQKIKKQRENFRKKQKNY